MLISLCRIISCGGGVIEKFENYFVFGFVRNPYDRVYSAYQYYKKIERVSGNFNDFIEGELNETLARYNHNYIHFCPQYYFFYDGNKNKADYIGRYEELDRDFYYICLFMGLNIETSLCIINQSKSNEKEISSIHLNKFTKESLDVVNELYALDFSLFGYQQCKQTFMDDLSPPVRYESLPSNIEMQGYLSIDKFYSKLLAKVVSTHERNNNFATSALLLLNKMTIEYSDINNKIISDKFVLENEKIAVLLAKISSLEDKIDGIETSNSWILTKPLRTLMNILKSN